MTEQEANSLTEQYKSIIGKYFLSIQRKDVYRVLYIHVIENITQPHDFDLFVGFNRSKERIIILDPLDLFLQFYTQID